MFWHCHSRCDEGEVVLLQLQKFSGGGNLTDFINANFKLAKTPLEIEHFGSQASKTPDKDQKLSKECETIEFKMNIARTATLRNAGRERGGGPGGVRSTRCTLPGGVPGGPLFHRSTFLSTSDKKLPSR
ncbi:hypothetical protein WUBG_16226 [Wuchereria bancrofti]|uniref:Uncharacterized protein n=1 Tax=Wuchereria bancrofti TaxID=6293 RepID=J9AFN3_WUCBA|nr:hypothetical protein WUBG_16226 [Wuchereria bancrofti]